MLYRAIFAAFAAVVAMTVSVGSAHADYQWTGAISGDWTDAGNWIGGVPVDVNGPDADLEVDNAVHRIIFDAPLSTNPLPTSNIPILGGYPFNNTQSTPETDVLFGDLTFTLGGFQGGVVGRDNWTTNIGDGNTANGTASLTYTSNFSSGLNRDSKPSSITFVVNADGTLNLNDTNATTIISYGTDRFVAFILNGGDVNFNEALDVTRNTNDLSDSFFDFKSAGSEVTAKFGVDFAMAGGDGLDNVFAAIGNGLTFRSTTDLELGAINNGDGTFTVLVVPEPASLALMGLGGLAMLRRK